MFYGDLNSPEVPISSKNSTTFRERLKTRYFLATSIVGREHAWNREWIL